MTVTIREVADAAGVSTATVSRTLSGVQTVDLVLAERVRRSAESLGYRANRVARAACSPGAGGHLGEALREAGLGDGGRAPASG